MLFLISNKTCQKPTMIQPQCVPKKIGTQICVRSQIWGNFGCWSLLLSNDTSHRNLTIQLINLPWPLMPWVSTNSTFPFIQIVLNSKTCKTKYVFKSLSINIYSKYDTSTIESIVIFILEIKIKHVNSNSSMIKMKRILGIWRVTWYLIVNIQFLINFPDHLNRKAAVEVMVGFLLTKVLLKYQ